MLPAVPRGCPWPCAGAGGAPRCSAVSAVPWGTAQAEIFLPCGCGFALPLPRFLRGRGCSLPSCHTEPRLGLFRASSPGDTWEGADPRTFSCTCRTFIAQQKGLKWQCGRLRGLFLCEEQTQRVHHCWTGWDVPGSLSCYLCQELSRSF